MESTLIGTPVPSAPNGWRATGATPLQVNVAITLRVMRHRGIGRGLRNGVDVTEGLAVSELRYESAAINACSAVSDLSLGE